MVFSGVHNPPSSRYDARLTLVRYTPYILKSISDCMNQHAIAHPVNTRLTKLRRNILFSCLPMSSNALKYIWESDSSEGKKSNLNEVSSRLNRLTTTKQKYLRNTVLYLARNLILRKARAQVVLRIITNVCRVYIYIYIYSCVCAFSEFSTSWRSECFPTRRVLM